VVHRPPDVGAGVDARHDQVERAEQPQSGEQHAQRRRAVERPRFGHTVDLGAVHLGLQQVQRTHCSTGTGELTVGGQHHHIAVLGHRPGQYVQAHRVDAVVVGHQDSHATVLAHDGERAAARR